MIIYFLRHASAGERKKNPKKDERRPLDAQGIEQCGDVGRALAALDVAVDALLSSPLKRATQTAALVGNEIGYERQLFIEKALRPEATFEHLSGTHLARDSDDQADGFPQLLPCSLGLHQVRQG